MKLKLTKKTYYTLGAVAAALNLVQAVAALAGLGLSLLDSLAFGFTGLMLLFLASVKGTTMGEKRSLFGCFLLLVFSNAVFSAIPLLQIVLMGLVWPCFAGFEKRRDERLTAPFRAICLMEILWMCMHIAVSLGGAVMLQMPSNLAGLGASAARLWLMVCLYKRERDEG